MSKYLRKIKRIKKTISLYPSLTDDFLEKLLGTKALVASSYKLSNEKDTLAIVDIVSRASPVFVRLGYRIKGTINKFGIQEGIAYGGSMNHSKDKLRSIYKAIFESNGLYCIPIYPCKIQDVKLVNQILLEWHTIDNFTKILVEKEKQANKREVASEW